LRSVTDLLERRLVHEDDEPRLAAVACALWHVYYRTEQPAVQRPAIYAAAAHYCAVRLHGRRVTQAALARRYGVSGGSVGRVVRQMRPLVDELASLAGGERSGGEGLAGLPRVEERWLVGIRRPGFVVERPQPSQPQLLLCIDPRRDLVLGAQLLAGPDGLAEAAGQLEGILAEPAVGLPRLPARLAVDDPALGEALAPLAGALGMQLERGPAAPLDRVIEHMRQFDTPELEPTYLGGPGADAAAVGLLFEAAGRLAAASCWHRVADTDGLEVRLDGLAGPAPCVALTGAGGLSEGALVFADRTAFAETVAGALADQESHWPRAGTLSLNYEAGCDLPEEMRREVMRHGWPVCDVRHYPIISRLAAPGSIEPCDGEDYRRAALGIAGAVAALTGTRPLDAAHRSREVRFQLGGRRWRGRVELHPGPH
jgi:hypothetical protein